MNLCCCGGGTPGDRTRLPNCACEAIPSVLAMTSGSSTCNYGMFQSCTISYQAVPPEYAGLNLGASCFLSDQEFPDVLAGGAMFRYTLVCYENQFGLSRVYATSPYGSPYRDALLYSWLIGPYGNTCNPFHLDNGHSYVGSDASCYVAIDA